jgi:hypothetical protein
MFPKPAFAHSNRLAQDYQMHSEALHPGSAYLEFLHPSDETKKIARIN